MKITMLHIEAEGDEAIEVALDVLRTTLVALMPTAEPSPRVRELPAKSKAKAKP